MAAQQTEYRLLTVNTVPERAKRLIGRVIADVQDRYAIVHVGNVERIEDVKDAVERERPDVLFTASMWTPEQAKEIVNIAQGVLPNLKTFSVPQGLQANEGPDAVVAYIKENLPHLLDS
ncbi:hypothetical protein MSAN_01304500 [Mycena sanguinolenta]|uniref:Uncharacterized protein n=1 Tax=Mycena sanguinolenta TaxID=230812 RepID=A0A8H6YDQ0_9AGAR|nr:hypothetical protein MSAN_01304500 [Mycena sanguinolenta]